MMSSQSNSKPVYSNKQYSLDIANLKINTNVDLQDLLQSKDVVDLEKIKEDSAESVNESLRYETTSQLVYSSPF
jgi:hypothetical protein